MNDCLLALSDRPDNSDLPSLPVDASLAELSSKQPGSGGAFQPVTFKVRVPAEHNERLIALADASRIVVDRMLVNRDETSSKFYKEVPCVIAKSLSSKYQRNPKCKQVKRLCLPVCGDKGKQVKIVGGGIRVPAIFGKAAIPVTWLHEPVGFIRSVEFFRRGGSWFGSVCINVATEPMIEPTGVVGVDRNTRENVAVLADPQTGAVRHMGFDTARTKFGWRKRKARLQRSGRNRLLHRIRRKQSRRTQNENHCVSKQIVDYAATHCRAIALEDLGGVRKDDSKIKRYSEKAQWAFGQLETFIRYKAALRGVPVIAVNPAYTSQTCSRCGSRHKPNGKLFRCDDCGHVDHRDANAAFNIALAGIGRQSRGLSEPHGGSNDGPASGKEVRND